MRITPYLLRMVFTALVIVSLLLGYRGFADLLKGQTSRFWDLLYYTLQLFVLDPAPLDADDHNLSLSLEIARFTAPAATAYALAAGAVLLFSTETRRLRARRSRGHAVICGTGSLAITLTERLRRAGHKIVVVSSAPMPAEGVLHVTGDPRDPLVLRAAGVPEAAVLYACLPDSAANTSVALAAHSLRRPKGRRLAAYALVSDPGMCVALRARRLGLPQAPDLHLDFFNPDELAARVLLERHPITDPAPVMIVGLSAFGRLLLVELARQWRLQSSGTRLPVTVVDEHATELLRLLHPRYSRLLRVCDITTLDEAPDLIGVPAEPPQRVYVCYADQELALRIALTSPWMWRGGPGSLVVRVDGVTTFGDAIHDEGLLEGIGGTLRVFAVAEAAGNPGLIAEDVVETLARAAHGHYVVLQGHRGDRVESNPSMAPWDQLSEAQKNGNRHQAEDIGRKLRMVGCALGPLVDPCLEFAFSEEEIEMLARLEHERWLRSMRAEGWRYGPLRDAAVKEHPDIEDWAVLSMDAKEKDRDTVRDLPDILADAGFQIVRIKQDA